MKIANLLGSKYLHFIIKEMKETLTKGYQVRKNGSLTNGSNVGIGACIELQYTYVTEWSQTSVSCW